MATLGQADVPALLAAFDLGSQGRMSDGPAASVRASFDPAFDADLGSWAVKQAADGSRAELNEALKAHAFQEAARAANVPTPAVRRPYEGRGRRRHRPRMNIGGPRVSAVWRRLTSASTLWSSAGCSPTFTASTFAGTIGEDPWYTDPVGAGCWAEISMALRDRAAPFANDVAATVPELVASRRCSASSLKAPGPPWRPVGG